MVDNPDDDVSEEDRDIAEFLLKHGQGSDGPPADSTDDSPEHVREFQAWRGMIADALREPAVTETVSMRGVDTDASGIRVPNVANPLPFDVPGILDKYELETVIGIGGMGVVYKARDSILDRDVALKVPRIPKEFAREYRERFLREGRLAVELSNSHLCTIYDMREHDGVLFMAMEFLDGQSFADLIAGKKKLFENEIVKIVRDVAEGVVAAHKEGVIHRDLKPSNIMVKPDGDAVVLDFGLAVDSSGFGSTEANPVTRADTILGTPHYMAPEQTLGAKVGEAADIFSLGVILYEAISGQRPFVADNALALMQSIREDEPVSLTSLRPDVSPELVAICTRMMAKKPEERFGSMQEVVAALKAFSNQEHPSKPPTRRLAGFAAGLVGLLLLSVLIFTGRNGQVRFEIADGISDLQIEFEDEGFTVANDGEEKSMRPGERKFFVKVRGKRIPIGESFEIETDEAGGKATLVLDLDGVKLTSNEFEVLRGQQHVFRVSVEAAEESRSVAYGTPKSGLTFDGDDDHVRVESFEYDGSYPLTIEVIATPTAEHDGYVIGNYNYGGYRIWAGNGQWRASMAFEGRGNDFLAIAAAEPEKTVHLALVRGRKVIRFFLNGRCVHRQDVASSFNPPRERKDLFIGADADNKSDGIAKPFAGVIHGVRFTRAELYTDDFEPPTTLKNQANTISCYDFEKGSGAALTDTSGNAHHGEINGATWEPGETVVRHGLRFGEGAYVETPVTYDGKHPLTLEALVELPELLPDSYQHIISNWKETGIRLGVSRHGWSTRLGLLGQPHTAVWSTSPPLAAHRYHVAFVYDGLSARMFLNGKCVAFHPLNEPLSSSQVPFLIGAQQSGMGQTGQFGGIIDEVRISKAAKYLSEFVPPQNFKVDRDAVALYQFDEGEGNEAWDFAGNNNDAKVVGAEWDPVAEQPFETATIETPVAPLDHLFLIPTRATEFISTKEISEDRPLGYRNDRFFIRQNGGGNQAWNKGDLLGTRGLAEITARVLDGDKASWFVSCVDQSIKRGFQVVVSPDSTVKFEDTMFRRGEPHFDTTTFQVPKHLPPGEFQTLSIRVIDETVTLYLNGQKVAEGLSTHARLGRLTIAVGMRGPGEVEFERLIVWEEASGLSGEDISQQNYFDSSSSKSTWKLDRMIGDDRLMHWNKCRAASVDFTADGTRVVSCSRDGTVRVFNADDGRCTYEKIVCPEGISSLECNPAAAYEIFTGSLTGEIRRLNLATDELSEPIYHHESAGSIWSITCSQDGQTIVTASEHTACAYSLKSGSKLCEVPHKGIRWATLSPNGNEMPTASGNSSAHIWDVQTGGMTASRKGHRTAYFNTIAVHPTDGRLALGLCNNGDKKGLVRIWNRHKEAYDAILDASGGYAWCVRFSPDGRWLADGRKSGEVHLWDTATWEKKNTRSAPYEYYGNKRCVSFNPAGDRIVSAGADNGVHIGAVESTSWQLEPRYGRIRAIDASTDGHFVVFGGDQGRVGAHDLESKTTKTWQATLAHVNSILFMPNGNAILIGDTEGQLASFDLSGRRIAAASYAESTKRPAAISALRLLDHGRKLLVGYVDGRSSIINVPTDGTFSEDLVLQEPASKSMRETLWVPAPSLESTSIISGCSLREGRHLTSGRVQLQKDSEAFAAIEFEDPVIAIAAHPDRDLLAVVTANSRSNWKHAIEPATELHTLTLMTSAGDRLHSVELPASAVTFSPAGDNLAICGCDGKLRILSVPDWGVEVLKLGPPRGIIRDAVFSPDGSRLYTANENGTVSVFFEQSE